MGNKLSNLPLYENKLQISYANNVHSLSSVSNILNWSSDAELNGSTIGVFNYVETVFF